MKRVTLLKALGIVLLLGSCATYYQKQQQFHYLFLHKRIAEATALLAKDKKAEKRKDRLLYFFNRGVLAHLQGAYQESNRFFEKAYIMHEDFSKKASEQIMSFLVNPMMTTYNGEDHEVLLLHYYKALNFLKLGAPDTALVECRRLNIKLNRLSDKYKSERKYQRDAFIHMLMGLVYQANHEYNNAFIAYRNAVEIYETDYKRLFGVSIPEQLKKDLIYVGYKTGFDEEVAYYQRTWQLDYDPRQETDDGDLVCFWNNGLGPIKHEWGVNFVIIPGAGGMALFQNDELGLAFSFPLPSGSGDGSITDLEMLRVAFPEYIQRPLLYHRAYLRSSTQTYPFALAEDINQIAFQVLQQRMMWEFSTSLMKVAVKKLAEHQLKKQNALLGTAFGVFNFVAEKADTRNWQTLPHSIFYTRARLRAGTHTFRFAAQSDYTTHQEAPFTVTIQKNATVFHTINTLEYGIME